MNSSVRLAYVAGLMDGEGCIRIKKTKAYRCQGRATPGYHAAIQIKMVSQDAIEFVCHVLGGWHFAQKSSLRSGRILYSWQATNRKAEGILNILLPLLIVKRQQAKIVLELRAIQKDNRKYRTKIVGYRNFPNQHGAVRRVPNLAFSDEYVARCEALYLVCKRLNRVGAAALEG